MVASSERNDRGFGFGNVVNDDSPGSGAIVYADAVIGHEEARESRSA